MLARSLGLSKKASESLAPRLEELGYPTFDAEKARFCNTCEVIIEEGEDRDTQNKDA